MSVWINGIEYNETSIISKIMQVRRWYFWIGVTCGALLGMAIR